jgi:hypothetical protein
MYMWNQVSCTKSYYANIKTSSPYNQWSYLKMSCPHHIISQRFCQWEASHQDASRWTSNSQSDAIHPVVQDWEV